MSLRRTLFITQEYNEPGAGGAGIFAKQLTDALAQSGVEVHVLAPGKENRRVTSPEGPIVHYRKTIDKPLLQVPSFYWQVWRQAKRIVKQERIDTIHANESAGLAALGLRPTVATLHHPVRYELGKASFLQRLLYLPDVLFETVVVKRAQRLTVPSHMVYDLLAKMNKRLPAKTEVIPNGVAEQFLQPVSGASIRKEWGIDEEEVVIFFPGGGRAKRKGGLDLLQALSQLSESYTCVISGEAREIGWKKAFEQAIDKAGLRKRVVLLGEVEYEDLPRHYAASDIVVYPSTFEGFGLPVLEAMASGKALVATATGEAPRIIKDKENGRLIPVGNIPALKGALEPLLTDKKLRERLGASARADVSRTFSWKAVAERIKAVHSALLQEAHS